MSEFLPESTSSFITLIFKKIRKSKLAVLALFCVFGQGFYFLLPVILGILIDGVFVKNNLGVAWFSLFPTVWLFSIVFSSLGKFYNSNITQDVRKISKKIIFKHIINLPNSIYIGRDAGEVEHLLQELSFNSRYFFSENLPFFIRTIVTLIMSVFVISYSSFDLVFVFLVWVILFIPISYFSAKKSINHVSNSLISSTEVSAAIVEVIENHELIPAFGTEDFEIERMNQILEKERYYYNKAQFKIDATDFFQRLLQISLPISIAIFLIFLNKLVILTSGSIASVFSFTLILTNQIGGLGKGILTVMEISERIRVALNKLKPHKEIQFVNRNGDIKPKSWDIKFENVNFGYEKNRLSVQNINLKIKENEKLGIIGYSGAGKTTLIKLLRGFYVPDSGHIYIGGNSLEKINSMALTQNVSEVSQTIPLFHRSIRENVAYGCADVSDERIWEVLRQAQIADYVKKLPNGLDTIVGVRGQRLSGGEKARIGIARALIRKSKIIIFDEATAAVDSESELLIQKGLEELIKERTLIAIAHRLSTLRKMETIVLMDKGQIVAKGTHNELLEQSALYKRLWDSQVFI